MTGAFGQPEATEAGADAGANGGPGPQAGISWLCQGWYDFYEHTLPGFTALAEEVRTSQQFPPVHRPAPDELCHCGSEKLYRNCHGTAPWPVGSSTAGA
jgi:hypothetical protein